MSTLNLKNGTKIKCGKIPEFNPSLDSFKHKFWIPKSVIALKNLEKVIRRKNKAIKIHCVYSKGRIVSVYVTEGKEVVYGSMFSINENKAYISAKTLKQFKTILGDLLHLYYKGKRLSVRSLLRNAGKQYRALTK